MRILVVPESFSFLSVADGVNVAGVLQSLLDSGHRIDVLAPRPESRLFPGQETAGWISGPSTCCLLEEKKFRMFFMPGRKKKKEIIHDWENLLRETALSYDLVLFLPFYNSFCSCMGMSGIDSGIPWMVHFPQPLFEYIYQREEKQFAENGNRFFWRGVEEVMRKAPFVSFASIYIAEYMKLHYKYLKKKSLYLPYHESVLAPCSREETSLHWNNSDFNILYWGDMKATIGVRRFFSAYEQFLDYLGTARRRVVLHVFGEVDRQFLRPWIRDHVKSERREAESPGQVVIPQAATVLLLIDLPGAGAYCFPPYLPVYLASGKPLMTITQQKSETGRLLGADYPYSCGYSDEADIILLLLLMWEQWQTGDLQGVRRDDMNYLFGVQNYGSVLSMAVKQYRGMGEHCCPAG